MATKMNNLSGKEWLKNSISIWDDIRKDKEELKLKHPAIYPKQLCERLISTYTKNESEVILDPFMGVGSTIMGAINTNRKGIGIELSNEFKTIAQNRINSSLNLFSNEINLTPELYEGDSTAIMKTIEDNSIDLCINSPPYWNILNQKRSADFKNIKNYSNDKIDVGNIKNYNDYLQSLKAIYSEVYRTLKPNKRCCTIVMDIRKKDKFFPLHIDITRIMNEIGFELEDIIIWDRRHEYNSLRPLGYPWVFRINKIHEYICIYLKRDKNKPTYYKETKP